MLPGAVPEAGRGVTVEEEDVGPWPREEEDGEEEARALFKTRTQPQEGWEQLHVCVTVLLTGFGNFLLQLFAPLLG